LLQIIYIHRLLLLRQPPLHNPFHAVRSPGVIIEIKRNCIYQAISRLVFVAYRHWASTIMMLKKLLVGLFQLRLSRSNSLKPCIGFFQHPA